MSSVSRSVESLTVVPICWSSARDESIVSVVDLPLIWRLLIHRQEVSDGLKNDFEEQQGWGKIVIIQSLFVPSGF
jgi:hypothetical protein